MTNDTGKTAAQQVSPIVTRNYNRQLRRFRARAGIHVTGSLRIAFRARACVGFELVPAWAVRHARRYAVRLCPITKSTANKRIVRNLAFAFGSVASWPRTAPSIQMIAANNRHDQELQCLPA